MNRSLLCLALIGTCLTVAATSFAASTTFVIRNASAVPNNAPVIQVNNTYVAGATEFVIAEGGQKAAWGTDAIDGATLDQMFVSITRYDDTTRFTAGSGPAVAPYFNIWVTDGLGNYAVIANEPSNPAFQPLFTSNVDGSKTYALDYTDLADKTAKIYETPGWNNNTSWVHNLFGNDPLTFADVASLKIEAPSAAYIQNVANGVGSGAPDELGTDMAYGFNWVFGDTLSNYVSGDEGFVVANMSAHVVPVPAAVWCGMMLMGGIGVVRRWRRRVAN